MRKVGLLIALVGFGAACDEDNPARHLDAGMVDSPMQMIDAPVTPQPVTITVKSDGIGQEGVVVHFQNADSSLVATEMTDATGTASHLMNAGGYVTAIDPVPQQVPAGLPQGPSHDIRTFAGVKPGDHLRIEEDNGGQGTTMTLTLPPQTNPSIIYYDVATSCGGTTLSGTGSAGSNPSGTVYFYGCTSADILVTAMDDGGNPLEYFFVANQAVTDTGTIDYTAKTFSGLATRTYTLGDQPANVVAMDVKQELATTKGPLTDFNASASGMPAMASISFPNIPNGLSIVEIDGRTNNMQHMALDWGGLSTTGYTTDFGARMLDDATGFSFDATTHAASWTQATAGVAPDFVAARIFGTRTTATEYRYVSWQIVAPYAAMTVSLPTLPAGTFDLNFTANDAVDVDDLIFGKVPGGYDTVRASFYAIQSPFELAVGANGSAQFAMLSQAKIARTKQPTAAKKTVLQHRTQSTR